MNCLKISLIMMSAYWPWRPPLTSAMRLSLTSGEHLVKRNNLGRRIFQTNLSGRGRGSESEPLWKDRSSGWMGSYGGHLLSHYLRLHQRRDYTWLWLQRTEESAGFEVERLESNLYKVKVTCQISFPWRLLRIIWWAPYAQLSWSPNRRRRQCSYLCGQRLRRHL